MTCRASFVKKYLLTKYRLDSLGVWRAISEAKPTAEKLPLLGEMYGSGRERAKSNKRPLKTYLLLGSAAGYLIYFC